MFIIIVIDHLIDLIDIVVNGIYIYNNTDGDDIRMLDDEMNNYGAYW